MNYQAKPQVNKSHYFFLKYNKKKKFINFWYQVNFVLRKKPETLLEIGPGGKTATHILKKEGVKVTTVDIDEKLEPDHVASVDSLPFDNDSFDFVLCSEVLEHLPYDLFCKSLKELKRVSRNGIILSLPDTGIVFMISIKIPILRQRTLFFKLPFFWKKHKFDGEHYWEIGKKDFLLRRIKKDIESTGLIIEKEKVYYDDPAHHFFILKKIK